MKVLIVREGHAAGLKPGDYDDLIESLQANISRAEVLGEHPEVEIVERAEDAEDQLCNQPLNEKFVVIFISRGMIAEAEIIAEKHPKVLVKVLTARMPEGMVQWINKRWIGGSIDQYCQLLLH